MLKKIFCARNLIAFMMLCFIAEIIFQMIPTRELIWYFSSSAQPIIVSIICIVLLIMPYVLISKCKIHVPETTLAIYAILLYFTKFLGTLRGFYHLIFWWDIFLHGVISAALVVFGFTILDLLKNSSMSFMLMAVFAFGFSISLGVIWEIFEFVIDITFSTTSQQFVSPSGELLVGQAALANTMIDLIANTIGAIVASVFGYISLQRQKGWLNLFYIKRVEVERYANVAEC